MDMQTKKSSVTTRHASAAARTTGGPDAIVMLREDHQHVSGLFAKYQKIMDEGDAATKEGLVRQICNELKIHTTLEEEIFYPAARNALDDKGDDLLDEATVEHASAKDLIAQLERASADEELYDAKVTVLGEYIKHHVKEEQEELFPRCRKAKMDLKSIGAAMRSRKQQLA